MTYIITFQTILFHVQRKLDKDCNDGLSKCIV